MHKLYAGIDLGTSGCRLIIIDSDKNIKSSSAISYQTTDAQTPELWWNAVFKLLKELPKEIKQNLHSLAIDGTSGTFLFTDKNGNPSSSVLMYDDLRSTEEAHQIMRVFPKNSGGQGASGSLARLIWLLKNEANPEDCHALHQADYILGKLANNYRLSDENNCLKLGYDIVNRCWPEDLLKQLGISLTLLPDVYPAGTVVSSIDKKTADSLGLPKPLRLVTGTTDSIAAFIATGATDIGEAVTSLGSTLVIKLITHKPIFAPELGIYSHRFVDKGEDKWLVGGASNSGGKVLKHYFTQVQLDAMTSKLKPESPTGLDYYPLIEKGERFPIADAQKEPRLSPRPESDVDFFQGMLEGIAKIEQAGFESLQKLGAAPLVSVRTVGWGAQNPAWAQIRKRYLGVDMISPEHTEAAYGSALLALRAIE
jgi:sugar (pentulose or hexulose) kinase